MRHSKYNLYLDSLFIGSLRRNWHLLHSPYFLPLLWLHIVPSQELFSLLRLWRTLIKFKDALNFSTVMVFVIISAGFFVVLWSPYHPRPIDVSCDTSHQYASSAMIYVILSEMNRTLTVAINPNWILYDNERLNQSSQPQSLIWCLASVSERATIFCNSAF